MQRRKSQKKKIVKKKVIKKKITPKVAKKKIATPKDNKKVATSKGSKKVAKTKGGKKKSELSSKYDSNIKLIEVGGEDPIEMIREQISEEFSGLGEDYSYEIIFNAYRCLDIFTDQPDSDACTQRGCDDLAVTDNYCRLHYISNWNVILKRREILKSGCLQKVIDELIKKYNKKNTLSVLEELHDEKLFFRFLQEMEVTAGNLFEENYSEDSVDDDQDISFVTKNTAEDKMEE